jgi:hypothetical protein
LHQDPRYINGDIYNDEYYRHSQGYKNDVTKQLKLEATFAKPLADRRLPPSRDEAHALSPAGKRALRDFMKNPNQSAEELQIHTKSSKLVGYP